MAKSSRANGPHLVPRNSFFGHSTFPLLDGREGRESVLFLVLLIRYGTLSSFSSLVSVLLKAIP